MSSAQDGLDTFPSRTMRGTFYSDAFVGRKTSGGDIFRQNQYTAAHRSIPLGSYVLVTNPVTGQRVILRVNDRCPRSGVIDMTKIAAYQLGIKGSRAVEVRMLPASYADQWALQDTNLLTEDAFHAFKDGRKKNYAHAINGAKTKTNEHKREPSGGGGVAVSDRTLSWATTEDLSPSGEGKKSPAANAQSRTFEYTGESSTKTDTLSTYKKNVRYVIELCVVTSHKAALQEIKNLPLELQKKVVLDYNQKTGIVRIILDNSYTHSKAVRTQEMLRDDYPNSTILEKQRQ